MTQSFHTALYFEQYSKRIQTSNEKNKKTALQQPELADPKEYYKLICLFKAGGVAKILVDKFSNNRMQGFYNVTLTQFQYYNY